MSAAMSATRSAAHSGYAKRSSEDFRTELLTVIPQLRAFARMLSGDKDRAEDLAQEALEKAWRH